MEATVEQDPRVRSVAYVINEIASACERALGRLAVAEDSAVEAGDLTPGMKVRLPGDRFPQVVEQVTPLRDAGEVLIRTNAAVRTFPTSELIEVVQ